jgi:DNA polymerase III alpha subunit
LSEIAHLQTHSHYSLRFGMLSPTDLVAAAVARGHRAIALTDRNALYGMVPFVEAARKAGIKPIVGAAVSLNRAGASGQVVLLVRDECGYRNLSRLLTRFHLGGRRGLDPLDLLESAQGLILLTGGKDGFIPLLLAAGREEEAKKIFSLWQEAFRCFVQIGPWWPVPPLSRLAGNLVAVKDAVEVIERIHDISLVPEELPLDDPESFALLQSGRTFGIYQMESDGVQSLLRQFRPTNLEDVTAVTSLYRPGPIDGGITPRYVARLRIGLAHIGGIGPVGVEAVLRKRGERPFLNIEDLRSRTGLSRAELEILITVGACDCFEISRPSLLWQLEKKKAAPSGQGNLFALLLDHFLPPDFPDLSNYSASLRRGIEVEKFGFAVTEESQEKVLGTTSIAEAKKGRAIFSGRLNEEKLLIVQAVEAIP